MTNIRHHAQFLCVLVVTILAGMLCAVLPTAQAEGNVSLINPDARGSLTVVKSAGDPFSQYGDPQRGGQPEPVKPIEGLVFKAHKVGGIDLTTNEGWQQATDLNIGDVVPTGSEHHRLDDGIEATTDASGTASFTDLDLGLYYVTELPGPAQEQGFNTIAPFLVSVPSTSDDGTSWNYDVNVNAKDQKLVGSKAVAKKCVEVGEDVQFGMSGTLPAPTREGTIARYEIVDPLAPELEYVGADEAFLTDVAAGDVTTKLDDADYTTHMDGSIVRFSLTESGLAKAATMRQSNPEVLVTWRFMVKANAQPKDGKVLNKGYILPQGFPEFDLETTPGIPTNEVTVNVGECGETPGTTPTPGTGTPEPTPNDTPTPGKTPEETPGKTPDKTPGVTPNETPRDTPETTAENTPGETPDSTTGKTPDNTPQETPADTPDSTPDEGTPDRGPRETETSTTTNRFGIPLIIPVPLVPVPVPGPGIPGHPEEFDPREPVVLAGTPPEDTVVSETPSDSHLAMTGANVLHLTGAGLLLLIAGGYLATRTTREGEQ